MNRIIAFTLSVLMSLTALAITVKVENVSLDVDVKDHYAFAAISRKKVKQALGLIRNEKIKGVKTIIEEAK